MLNRKLAAFLLLMVLSACATERAAEPPPDAASRIDVVGFADGSGSESYNIALSLPRANAVKVALVNEGVPSSAIEVIAKGATQPLVATPDGVREWQNRRVELVLH